MPLCVCGSTIQSTETVIMNMGSFKLQSAVETNEEEPGHYAPNGGAFACMVNSEIGAVLAVMRRNVGWGGRYMVEDDPLEHSLVRSLKALRKNIFSWDHNWHAIDPCFYLQSFLDVVQSDEISAPITGVALSSVYKIITLGIFDSNTANVEGAMHLVVDTVTSCRFEVTDSASEEVVLMKILQVLLACMKSKVSFLLNDQHVCTIVNTCFRIVHQAGAKGELLQRIARHTMHELVRCIFSHLRDLPHTEQSLINGGGPLSAEPEVSGTESTSGAKQSANGSSLFQNASISVGSVGRADETAVGVGGNEDAVNGVQSFISEPYGVACMVEVFQFLCSLLNIGEQIGMSSRSMEFNEDVPLFALGLINSVIELGGPTINRHPKLLGLIQDELFRNLMQFGLSMSPLILSMVCNIILNLYLHLRRELKLQLEAFFSCVVLRLAHSKHGDASYQQQEVLMEALVDFCRQKTFMAEMYANFDCDISCSNVFEDICNLLSKSAFPVNSPLSSMNILALEGLVAVVQGMAERVGSSVSIPESKLSDLEEYTPFWSEKCPNYSDPNSWVGFVRQRKHIKKKLMSGVDHFNRDPKKGLEVLQRIHMLPSELDPSSVACLFRYSVGLDKTRIGDFLGNHDEFWVKVLYEYAQTFDFQGMSLDTALRLFLESFRLPGESQKIQRAVEAFSERYYEQSPQILANKDAALLLSYSIIMLNTDQHNVRVKKKMTEDDFVRNNRHINGGNDLPRQFLLDLYRSICKNEIKMTPEQGAGFPEMTPSYWIILMHKSQEAAPFITCESMPFLERDMFAVLSGPTLAAISVVYDHAEHEDVYQVCLDGFLAIAKISSCPHFMELLDDIVVSLCKFTTLLDPSQLEEGIISFAEDMKALMATSTVFTIANRFGDYIRSGWRNIMDCILSLHKLGLLPALVGSDSADDNKLSSDHSPKKPVSNSLPVSRTHVRSTSLKATGILVRFTQLLSLDTEEPRSEPSEEELAAHQRASEIIQKCKIISIFTDSMFLQSDSLLHLVQSLILVSGPNQKRKTNPAEDEDSAVFCLELLITVTLCNRDRIVLLWPIVYEHITAIVQSTAIPCALVEKAVFGLLHICQRLLPYKEQLADELLKSLQLILKLDARVADAYCEHITQEVADLVKANAVCIKSHTGWRTIISLLSITARHPEAYEAGFEALGFIMSEGAHLSPANYIVCLDAAIQFVESRVGSTERSIYALDLIAGSFTCLTRWGLAPQEVAEIWLRLLQVLKKVCLDQREEVRSHAILSMQRCTIGVENFCLPPASLISCFDHVVFVMLDDMFEMVQGKLPKDYGNMEGTLVHALRLLSKLFCHLVGDLFAMNSFPKLWLGILDRMENFSKVKIRGRKTEELRELVPELLKNNLLLLKTKEILVKPGSSTSGSNANKELWELTWTHVKNIAPSLESEIFTEQEAPQQKETAS